MKKTEYNYARLTASSASGLVSIQYDLPEVKRSCLYALGLHDNYLIECEQNKYILRLYRNDWRSPDEIDFELELLAFLEKRGASVAAPKKTRNGEWRFLVNGPEGERTAALFTYAEGDAPGNRMSEAQGALLGKAVAELHESTELFESANIRKNLDIPYLLDESVVAIEPFLDDGQKIYIKELQRILKGALPSLSTEPGIFGICTGDVNSTNFHITGNNQITLFDFDQCGYGFRAFEIGKFISSIHPGKNKDSIAKAFLDGYQQVRRLNINELDAIPCFEIISVIWVMAIHVYNADLIGYKCLEKPFWNRRLALIEELAHRFLKPG